MNRSKILWSIDTLTIIFLIIQVVSMFSYIKPENYWFYPLKEQLFHSLSLYTVVGWSEVLHNHLGAVVPWSKTLLFFANIYAVILKLIGIIRRTIPTKRFAFIVINLLFIVLKLIEFDSFLTALMSV